MTGQLPITSALRAKHHANGEETIQLEIYVCDTTKNGDSFLDFETWIGLISRAVCELAGGCQVYRGQGLWIKKEDGELCCDGLATIKATVERKAFIENTKRLRYVLVQYGREAEKEFVGLSLNGEFFTINPSEPY